MNDWMNVLTRVKQLIKQKSYKNMLQKAQGVKVKDDPKLLKKSIKKKEKKKAKSAAAWFYIQ